MTRFEVESAGQKGQDERHVGSLPGKAIAFEAGQSSASKGKSNILDVSGGASCGRDQNDQKRRQSDTRLETEARFADLSGLVSDWIWEIDDGLCLTYASERVTDALGYHPSELIGRSFGDLAVDSKALVGLFDQRHPVPSFRGREVELRSRSGEARVFSLSGLPVYCPHSHGLVGYRGTAQDITALSLQAAALEAAVRAADTARRIKSEFFANTSHELRTPLNAIIGFTEIMHAGHFGPIDSARYRDYLGNVLESARHLLSLIDDILDVAETETGEIDLQESLVDPAELLRQAYCLVSGPASRAGIALEQKVPPLPRILADGSKIRQVLMNLLSNAIKYTPAGGTVILSADLAADGDIVFRIEDNGIGISGRDKKSLLTPFEQADSHQRSQHQGAGLGLPLSDALVKRHGGRMDLHSIPGQGTKVTVTLPAHRVIRDLAGRGDDLICGA